MKGVTRRFNTTVVERGDVGVIRVPGGQGGDKGYFCG